MTTTPPPRAAVQAIIVQLNTLDDRRRAAAPTLAAQLDAEIEALLLRGVALCCEVPASHREERAR